MWLPQAWKWGLKWKSMLGSPIPENMTFSQKSERLDLNSTIGQFTSAKCLCALIHSQHLKITLAHRVGQALGKAQEKIVSRHDYVWSVVHKLSLLKSPGDFKPPRFQRSPRVH